MLYHLSLELSETIPVLNVFRYLTFRTGAAIMTALFFVFLFGPGLIATLKLKQGRGQPIRSDGPERHIIEKQGTPTMGGLMILAGILVASLLWADLANIYVWAVLFVTLGFGAIGFYDDLLKVTRALASRLFRLGAAEPGMRHRRRGGRGLHAHRHAGTGARLCLSLLQEPAFATGMVLPARRHLRHRRARAIRSTSPTGSTGLPSCR